MEGGRASLLFCLYFVQQKSLAVSCMEAIVFPMLARGFSLCLGALWGHFRGRLEDSDGSP